MKIFKGLFVLLLPIILLAACNSDGESGSEGTGGNNSNEDVYELIFTNVQPANHATNLAAEWLAEELDSRTDGRVQLDVKAGGALGGPDEIIAGMRLGDIDLAWISTSNMANHIPALNIFGVSYLVQDNDHYSKLASVGSDLMNELEDLVEEADIGSRLVGMMGGSPRRLYNTKRPVHTPEDLKGLSIRIQDSSVEANVWSALGAQPVPLAWDEIYTALQSGVIDGAESSTSSYESNKFHEVAPYHSLTEHQYMFLPLFMSETTYNELPEDLRDIVLEAVEEAATKSWEIFWEEDIELTESLQEEGVEINEVDTAPFMEIVSPIAEEVAEANNAEKLLELIRED